MVFVEAARQHSHLSGLELLRKLLDGSYPKPPVAEALTFQLTEVAEGRSVFVMDVGEYHYNPIGMVHGGVAATLLDSAMACAVHTTLKPGESYTTLELKVNFFRALTVATPQVKAEGIIVHRGKTTAISEATMADDQGRVFAKASCTCLIFPARS
jgi:uncharacterized protein (TIGR00369 family)